ncbi:MAG: glycoside hydrolase/phage tail family protein [Hyphomicrobiales bacterium]|nr:glycoside hydrolase/phage tail family protein [Hyphomicrobiales bacterium]
MATLALSAAGSAIGNAVLPGVGGVIGRAAGAVAGGFIDSALFGASGQTSARNGSRLSDLQVTASTEGAAIPRLYGRARLGGQVIWATNYEEEVVSASSGSGKGTAAPASAGKSYCYYANFAVALCEGPITRVGRCWADGEELDLSQFTYRVHKGDEAQAPDSLIEAKQGAGLAPAYRGLAYVVFERMPLRQFGNRIPQLNFEVFRAVDDFEAALRAVTLIPAAGEFAYEPTEIRRDAGDGVTLTENRRSRLGGSDFSVALDQLQDTLPNAAAVSLFVAWFGDDLRCGDCTIRPKVEIADKKTAPLSWSAAGLTRATAQVVSQVDGRPAFGGTPSDASVIAAIKDLRERGLSPVLTPFILLDVAAGNTLPDPYRAGTPAGQAVYPWRGRITCSPAPGVAGSPDKTATAETQVAAFVGTAAVSDFAMNGEMVTYTGPNEWSYRRFILHLAHLCAAAGGVDAFVIGSEMRGLTWVRESASSYPFVTALKVLAADVSTVLPTAKVTYAADWSEWFGHQPGDGSGDVYFHLDPLWSDANIDAIGIDNYWPLSDWRDSFAHADYQAGWRSPQDVAYLKTNLTGGEGYDWFYASPANRDAQVRTPITDGAYSKPWVFRFKDIKNWWLNQHYNRPLGVESGTPTAWTPQSKPFWFMEMGCPAVDRGSNQPNVFYDPKSSESALPYYSRGARDDLIQRRYLQAFIDAFDPSRPGFDAAQNPVSAVYGARMVEPSRMFAYTWDARPYPAFPNNVSAWADGPNWAFGHWLNGRLAGAPLGETVAAICADSGFDAHDAAALTGQMQGYLIDRVMSARDAIQPLELAFFFDSVESGGRIRFKHRGQAGAAAALNADDLVETSAEAPLIALTRGQETELPQAVKLAYADAAKDYEQGAAEARRQSTRSGRVAQAAVAAVMDYEQAQGAAETWLHEAWSTRESAAFALPPSRLALEASDVVTVSAGGRSHDLRITETSVGEAIAVEARSIAAQVYERGRAAARPALASEPLIFGPVAAAFMDLPLITGAETPHAARLATFASPWAGAAFYRSASGSGFALDALLEAPATMGETTTALGIGPTARWDRGARLGVRLYGGGLQSVAELDLLGGANLAAIENADGEWEVIQFASAALTAPRTYELSGLLRGQFGTEGAMRASVAAGARFVLLDAAVIETGLALGDIRRDFVWTYGPANRAPGDPSYATVTRAVAGLGLRPLSPVHVRGARASGDLAITWVRRTRLGGDGWEAPDAPLAEEREAYEVDILSGATVKRTLAVSAPLAVYTAAQQTADFGAPQAAVAVRVHQMSAVYGRGAARQATV